MNYYFLYWIGPCFGLSSFLIFWLQKGSINFFEESPLFLLSLIGLLKNLNSRKKKLIFSLLFCSSFFLLNSVSLFFITSLILSTLITQSALQSFEDFKKEKEKTGQEALILKRLLDAALLEKNHLTEKLSDLYWHQMDVDVCETEFKRALDEDKRRLDALQREELYLAKLEKELAPKEERKPLRRLRRIAMKQTSFLDDLGVN